jgi:hypothetical protein
MKKWVALTYGITIVRQLKFSVIWPEGWALLDGKYWFARSEVYTHRNLELLAIMPPFRDSISQAPMNCSLENHLSHNLPKEFVHATSCSRIAVTRQKD